MSDCKLSIIIPCYNGYKFLKNTINEMKIPDWAEVIIVDDCSLDDSYRLLLNEFGENNRIIIKKNQVNSGPGLTRNNGIKYAQGEYITFLDSDDCFVYDFFDDISNIINENHDCIIFDYLLEYKNGKRKTKSSFSVDIQNGVVCNKKLVLFSINGSTWAKIYKKEIIELNKIKFLNQNRNEDLPFTKTVVSNCNSIFYIKEPLYIYKYNSSSLMHQKKLLNPKNALNAFEYINENISDFFFEEKKGIFILECLYSTGLNYTRFLNRKDWCLYIDSILQNRDDITLCLYFKNYSFRIKSIIKIILMKKYFLAKMIRFFQDILRGSLR